MRIHRFLQRSLVVFIFCGASAMGSSAQTLTTLQSFDTTDGANPTFGVIQGLDGNFYGTTPGGGASGSGTVYKITPGSTLTTLYSFCKQANCADGGTPESALVQSPHGDFYGTTYAGGANGFGTVFKITPAGTLTTLYSFCSLTNCKDGNAPEAALILAADGNFYGTTQFSGGSGFGTVFKITPAGKLTTLYNFDLTHGATPVAALVQASDGNFYGTTFAGGSSAACFDGCGTVFKITPGGTLTSLYSFCVGSFTCPDGDSPDGSLIQASDGNFYSTAFYGGTSGSCGSSGCGTVFKITLAGTLTTLHNFDSIDGANPNPALVQATDGNFYGTTTAGGASGNGAVFEMTSGGAVTTLHSFGSSDGSNPYAALFQGTNGIFYGTTFNGGASTVGTVFSLSTGLGAFVETQPAVGKVGSPVLILGTSLAGATGVHFNGTAAAFKVVSSTLIKTKVPAGATTGVVSVTTPSGTLDSNKVFVIKR